MERSGAVPPRLLGVTLHGMVDDPDVSTAPSAASRPGTAARARVAVIAARGTRWRAFYGSIGAIAFRALPAEGHGVFRGAAVGAVADVAVMLEGLDRRRRRRWFLW